MDSLKKQIEERKRKMALEKEALNTGNKYVKRGELEKDTKKPEPV